MAREASEGSHFRQAVSQEESWRSEAWNKIDFLAFYRKQTNNHFLKNYVDFIYNAAANCPSVWEKEKMAIEI